LIVPSPKRGRSGTACCSLRPVIRMSGVPRLVAIAVLATACLVVALAVTGSTLASISTPRLAVDLGSGQIDGHRVIGRSVAGVTAALGAPGQRLPNKRRYLLRYDRLAPPLAGWGITVLFRQERGVLRAWSIALRDPRLTEPRLGRLLQLTPKRFQEAVLTAYPDRFSIVRPFRCSGKPQRCRGELAPRDAARLHVTFGSSLGSKRPSLDYVVVFA
jgi:hypothetical protein